MTTQISKVLPAEIVEALVAADPAVVEAMKASAIRNFSKKFDEEIVKPITKELVEINNGNDDEEISEDDEEISEDDELELQG